MSAYVCSRPTILAVAALAHGEVFRVREALRGLNEIDTIDQIRDIAITLCDANVASVEHRYAHRDHDYPTGAEMFPPASAFSGIRRERILTTEGKRLRDELLKLLEMPAITLAKACQCFHYQSCEIDGYEKHDWFPLYTRALSNVLSRFEGYDAAPWGIE